MSERPTLKKRQHYVPQMVQRRFSSDNKQINVWNIREGRSYKASIRNQFQERYYYEKTEEGFEEVLGRLESKAKQLFDEIEKLEKIPERGSEDWELLVFWIVMQVQRTDEFSNLINQHLQGVVGKTARALEATGKIPEGPGGLSVKDLDIQIDSKFCRQYAIALAFNDAISQAPIDLNAVILQSRDRKIILPDCGAIRFNLIAEEGNMPQGWSSVGLGALLPLSSRCAVVLYDPATYVWTGNDGGEPKIMDETEQVTLAKTTFLRSSKRVAFHTDPDWIKIVDVDLRSNHNALGQSTITIPGLMPCSSLMELACNAPSPEGLPLRPTCVIRQIQQGRRLNLCD